MNKYDIEIAIMNSIKEPIENIIKKSINTISSNGYNFEEDTTKIGVWVDTEKNIELDVNSVISVSCREISEETISSINAEQLEIENEFYELAEEGKDEKVHILASFEGEIANGGFEQLFLNKDLDFIKRALEILHSIGAKTKYRLSKEAFSTIQDYSQTITKYTEFQNNLSVLDDRFESTSENIPILYFKKYKV